jgi:Microtubule-binding stalk of dynein motor
MQASHLTTSAASPPLEQVRWLVFANQSRHHDITAQSKRAPAAPTTYMHQHGAAAGLLKWVLAMVNYYNVAKGVEPKRRKVADAEKSLRLAQRDLASTKEQLAALNSQLSSLRVQFGDKTAEQQARGLD